MLMQWSVFLSCPTASSLACLVRPRWLQYRHILRPAMPIPKALPQDY